MAADKPPFDPTKTAPTSKPELQQPPSELNKKSESKPESSSQTAWIAPFVRNTHLAWIEENEAFSAYVPSARCYMAQVIILAENMCAIDSYNRVRKKYASIEAFILYCAKLYYAQLLRVMRANKALSNADLREAYTRMFDASEEKTEEGPSSFIVPEPLISILSCLTSFDHQDGDIGKIVPVLPRTTGATAATGGILHDELAYLLPSIPHMEKSIIWSTVVGDNNPDPRGNVHDSGAAATAAAFNAAGQGNRIKNTSPGLRKLELDQFARQINKKANQTNPRPSPFANANGFANGEVNTWVQFLRLQDENKAYNQKLKATAIKLCTVFTKNATLDELPTHGSRAGAILYTYGRNFGANAHAAEDSPQQMFDFTEASSMFWHIERPLGPTGGLTKLEVDLATSAQLRIEVTGANHAPNVARINVHAAGEFNSIVGGANTLRGPAFDANIIRTHFTINAQNNNASVENNIIARLQKKKYQ